MKRFRLLAIVLIIVLLASSVASAMGAAPQPAGIGAAGKEAPTQAPAKSTQLKPIVTSPGLKAVVFRNGVFSDNAPYLAGEATAWKATVATVKSGALVSREKYFPVEISTWAPGAGTTGGMAYSVSVITGLSANDIVCKTYDQVWTDDIVGGSYASFSGGYFCILISDYVHNAGTDRILDWLTYVVHEGDGTYTLYTAQGVYWSLGAESELPDTVGMGFRTTESLEVYSGASLVNPLTSSRGYTYSSTGVTGGTLAANQSYTNDEDTTNEAWVDDDFTSATPGWGFTHFATVQGGVNAVMSGGTVHVAAGTYAGNITINKSLTLQSLAGAAATTISGASGTAVTISANGVTIDGFTITNPAGKQGIYAQDRSNLVIKNNIITGIGTTDATTTGTNFGLAVLSSAAAVDSVTIQDNQFSYIAGGNFKSADAIAVGWSNGDFDITNLTVQRNAISHVTSSVLEYASGGRGAYGILLNHAAGGAGKLGKTVSPQILNNTISDLEGLWAHGIGLEGDTPNAMVRDNQVSNLIDHKSPSDAVAVQVEANASAGTVVITLNGFQNLNIGVQNTVAGVSVKAESNYWGTTVASEIVPKISGAVDWSPWCNSNFTNCTNAWSVHNTTKSTDHPTIQSAIDAATAGDQITADAGTYIENIVVNKSVTIAGAGQTSTFVQPAISAANPCTGSSLCGGTASNVFLVQANDVVIHDLTVDGDNPGLTSGIVRGGADVDARNGIIMNTMLLPVSFTGLDVHNVTVKNIYLRGINATSGGTYNIHHNTVTNVQGDGSSIAIFGWYGPGSIANNDVSWANDAIAVNHSKGVQFLNNVVTNSGSGVHTDNSGDGGGTADLISGNSVTCVAGAGAYGIWVFVPYLAPTVDLNTVTNCDVGLSAWGQGGTGAPVTSFTNNTVNGSGADGSVGAYVTTDLISWGYADVAVSFQGNVIQGFAAGLEFAAQQQSWNPELYEAKTINATFFNNSIAGNATGAIKGTGGAYDLNLSGNWWGDADPADVKAIVNGGVGMDYSPWLASGADTSTDPGFQGDFSTLWVDDDSPQTGTTGRIQEGINLVSGSTVNVAAGLYVEDLTVSTSVNLLGPKSAVARNSGSATDWTSATTASWTATEATAAGEAVIRSAAVVLDKAVVTIAEDCDVTVKGLVIEARNRTDGTNAHLIYVKAQNTTIQTVIIENNIIGPITGAAQDGNKGRFGVAFDSQSTGLNGLAGSVKGNKILGAEGNGANVFVIGSHYNPSMSDYSGMVIEYNDVYGSNRSGMELVGGLKALTVRNNSIMYNGYIWNGTAYVQSSRSLAAPNNILFGAGINLIRSGTICNTYQPATQNAIEDLTLSGNAIAHNEKSGIYVDAQQRNLTIAANVITSNGRDGIWLDEFGTYNESWPYNEAYGYLQDATITNNVIGGAIAPYAAIKVTGKPPELAITENNLVGNAKGVVQEDGVGQTWVYAANASANWWGTNTPAGVAALVSADVDYTPWLAVGTDSGDPGFQGDFSTLWVDDDSPQTGATGRIQEGINLVTVGGTVNVVAGTYVEDPVVDKAVTLLGPNAGIDPTTGTRVAEATLHPTVSYPDPAVCEVILFLGNGVTPVNVSDITIDGFIFDGDNPALTSGIVIDGADVDACVLIGGWYGTYSDITIRNNVFRHATYAGIDLSTYPAWSVPTAGNVIAHNRFEDIGETTYNKGIGVIVHYNTYADITYNVMTGVRIGIQTENITTASPAAPNTISHNTIGAWRLGIFHNTRSGTATTYTLADNTVTAESYPGITDKWNGILLSVHSGIADTVVRNNDITIADTLSYSLYSAGYNVWSTSTGLVTIEGGTITGGSYGIFVNNYEGYSDTSLNTLIDVDGVTILGSGVAGVYVKDNPLNTHGATVYANVLNCMIDTDAIGILVDGADASATIHGNSIINNVTGIQVQNAGTVSPLSGNSIAGNTTLGVNNTTTVVVDATSNWWGDPSGCGPVGGTGLGDHVSTLVNCASPLTSSPTGIAAVSVSPPTCAVARSGGSAVLTVNIAGVTDLRGYQFKVNYDALRVSAVGAFVNSWFNTVGEYIPAGWNADCSSGQCWFAVTKFTGSPVSGGGPVAAVTLTGLPSGSAGTFTVDFSDVILGKDGGDAIDAALFTATCAVYDVATINGTVTMQGRLTPKSAGTVTLADQTGFLPAVQVPFLATDGSFTAQVPWLPTSTLYDITASHWLYLSNKNTGYIVNSAGPFTLPSTKLLGGDAMNDGSVQITDLSCIGFQFGHVPDVNACGGLPNSPDINEDGTVNILDLVLAGGNFYKVSPQAW